MEDTSRMAQNRRMIFFAKQTSSEQGVSAGRKLFYDGLADEDSNFLRLLPPAPAPFSTIMISAMVTNTMQHLPGKCPALFNRLGCHLHWDGGVNHRSTNRFSHHGPRNGLGENLDSVLRN